MLTTRCAPVGKQPTDIDPSSSPQTLTPSTYVLMRRQTLNPLGHKQPTNTCPPQWLAPPEPLTDTARAPRSRWLATQCLASMTSSSSPRMSRVSKPSTMVRPTLNHSRSLLLTASNSSEPHAYFLRGAAWDSYMGRCVHGVGGRCEMIFFMRPHRA